MHIVTWNDHNSWAKIQQTRVTTKEFFLSFFFEIRGGNDVEFRLDERVVYESEGWSVAENPNIAHHR